MFVFVAEGGAVGCDGEGVCPAGILPFILDSCRWRLAWYRFVVLGNAQGGFEDGWV